MADMTIPVNDCGFNLSFAVKDSDGDAYDLTNYSINLKVWKPGVYGTLVVNGVCNVTNASLGTCTYTVTNTDFTSIADYKMELELTKTGIKESTENYDLKVEESG
jgi:hypothetical protein